MSSAFDSPVSRRGVLRAGAIVLGALATPSRLRAHQPVPKTKAVEPAAPSPSPFFTISLAEWSLHRALKAGTLDHLDFPRAAKQDYGIDACEYVNTFFKDKAKPEYIRELKKRCDDLGVKSILIMCDEEGELGDADEKKRGQAVENHAKWIEAAKTLGCHSIRVNARSSGTPDEQRDRVADGLHRLCEIGETHDINVIVENHGGLSSHGDWLVSVMKKVDHKRIGTLPDLGNFTDYDRYRGVREMMPWAKGVSAKSYDFAEKDMEIDGRKLLAGDETKIDYRQMMAIVQGAGYHGRLGIEYEGERLSEPEGIRATKRLLERIHAELASFRASERVPSK